MIVRAAISFQGKIWSLPQPKRHHHVVHRIYLCSGLECDDGIQGFLDDTGQFLDRAEALKHVLACGQTLIRPTWDDWLYSENLW